MKSTFIQPIVIVFLAIFALGGNANAQEAANPVAILDVAKVFKNNPVFDAKMKAIKAEADKLKETITQQQESIKERAMGLTAHDRGSVERNRLEAELEQEQTKLRTIARQEETKLLNREAKVYYDTYQQMQSVVAEIATEFNLSLVLRFDSEPIDANNRTEVIKGVNRSVVFHRKRDLTGMVTNKLNARMAQGGGASLK